MRSHLVTSPPVALFHDDGMMRKNKISDLMHKLEKNVQVQRQAICNTVDKQPACVRDAMSIIHKIFTKPGYTYDDMASEYLKTVMLELVQFDTVIDVFDRYDNIDSIKSVERNRRYRSLRKYEVLGGRTIPSWSEFMSVSENKAEFNVFLCEYLKLNLHAKLARDSSVILAGGFTLPEQAVCITSDGSTDRSDLYSAHEEADTRIIFHLFNLDKSHTGPEMTVMVKVMDTDIFILLVHYFSKDILFETGSQTGKHDLRRIVSIRDVCSSIPGSLCEILPAVHALTGCAALLPYLE